MLKIYGASDDLIEIEGDVVEEFSCIEPEKGTRLCFSDGTLLAVEYDDEGIWRFNTRKTGRCKIAFTLGGDDDAHSDVVVLTGEKIRWVALADQVRT